MASRRGSRDAEVWVAVPLGCRRDSPLQTDAGTLAYLLTPVFLRKGKRSHRSAVAGKLAPPPIGNFVPVIRLPATGGVVPEILADFEDMIRITGYSRGALNLMVKDPDCPVYRFDRKLWFLVRKFAEWHARAKAHGTVRGPSRGGALKLHTPFLLTAEPPDPVDDGRASTKLRGKNPSKRCAR